MTTADKVCAFLAIVALIALIGFALWSNARAHGDWKGEA
jgi:hypothetical protein